jgi:tetratricopeptide (TPR) repeat protein
MKIKKRKEKPILKRARKPAEAAAKTRFQKLLEPVTRRWKLIVIVAGAVVVAGAGVGGYFWYRSDRETRAARAYSRVQENIADLVREETKKKGEDAKLDEDKITAKTVSELENLVSRFGDTGTGRAATYELASLYFDQGKYDEARQLFGRVEKNGSGPAKVLAAKGVADCYKAAGEYEAAITQYRRVFDAHKDDFPSVPVAMDMAECYKAAGKEEEALKLYRYVVDYNRLSPYADRAELELKKAEAEKSVKGSPVK